MIEQIASLDVDRYQKMHPRLKEVVHEFAEANGVPINRIFEIEILQVGMMEVGRIHLYKLDDQGKKFLDHTKRAAAVDTYDINSPVLSHKLVQAVNDPKSILFGAGS